MNTCGLLRSFSMSSYFIISYTLILHTGFFSPIISYPLPQTTIVGKRFQMPWRLGSGENIPTVEDFDIIVIMITTLVATIY